MFVTLLPVCRNTFVSGNQFIDMISAAILPAMGPLTFGSAMVMFCFIHDSENTLIYVCNASGVCHWLCSESRGQWYGVPRWLRLYGCTGQTATQSLAGAILHFRFFGAQGAAYSGYIDVNWGKATADVRKASLLLSQQGLC
jgi:hypothetical protein